MLVFESFHQLIISRTLQVVDGDMLRIRILRDGPLGECLLGNDDIRVIRYFAYRRVHNRNIDARLRNFFLNTEAPIALEPMPASQANTILFTFALSRLATAAEAGATWSFMPPVFISLILADASSRFGSSSVFCLF